MNMSTPNRYNHFGGSKSEGHITRVNVAERLGQGVHTLAS